MQNQTYKKIREVKLEAENWKLKTESGVALLFSILLTSALLLVALGISQISYKETVFSLEARDSARAFTAADTGLECALYADTGGLFTSSSGTSYSCAGHPVVIYPLGTDSYTFSLRLGPDQCSQIYVDKAVPGTTGTSTMTRIEAYGYNIDQQDPGTGGTPPYCVTNALNPRIVTRALRVNYTNP